MIFPLSVVAPGTVKVSPVLASVPDMISVPLSAISPRSAVARAVPCRLSVELAPMSIAPVLTRDVIPEPRSTRSSLAMSIVPELTKVWPEIVNVPPASSASIVPSLVIDDPEE